MTGEAKRPAKYAVVTIMVPVEFDQKSIPSGWFHGVPEAAIYAADYFETVHDQPPALTHVGVAQLQACLRKIARDGWPITQPIQERVEEPGGAD